MYDIMLAVAVQATLAGGSWDLKDVIVVAAAVGFVALLAVCAFVVKRRGEGEQR
jgi:hypothetical protein